MRNLSKCIFKLFMVSFSKWFCKWSQKLANTYLENKFDNSHNTHQNHMDDREIDKPDRNCLSFCPSFFPRNFLTKGYNSNLSRKVKNYIRFPNKIYLVQAYLFQKLTTSEEHVVYQNCSEFQNKKTHLCTQHVLLMFWASNFSIFMNNLWVS